MNKNQIVYCIVAAILILSTIGSMAGCITLYENKPGNTTTGAPVSKQATAAPVIKSFTALPNTVNPGQQVQLQWEITDATSADINPVVGKVSQSDTVLVSPTATTTYTLTASNAVGTSTATVQVNVASTAGRPDIVVTKIYLVTREVYYTAKNIGSAPAKGSRTSLSVNGIVGADDYLEALDPGQERTGPFKNYAWTFALGDSPTYSTDPRQFTLKVCVDSENTVVEGDESNNCMSVIWGEKFGYDFITVAHQAFWSTGYGPLKLPLPEDNLNGAAMSSNVNMEDNRGYGQVLLTVPQHVPGGYIVGRFGDFYQDRDTRSTMVRDLTMLPLAKFTAMVGFSNNSPSNCKANFMFGTIDPSGAVTFFPSVTATNDGKLDLYQADLTSLAGQKRQFILRVEALDGFDGMKPVWVDPKVSQP